MKILLPILSFIGLALTVLPSFLVFSETISMELNNQLMLAGMVLWFVTAPFWMNKKQSLTMKKMIK